MKKKKEKKKSLEELKLSMSPKMCIVKKVIALEKDMQIAERIISRQNREIERLTVLLTKVSSLGERKKRL